MNNLLERAASCPAVMWVVLTGGAVAIVGVFVLSLAGWGHLHDEETGGHLSPRFRSSPRSQRRQPARAGEATVDIEAGRNGFDPREWRA
jgi:hypothetical protein